MSYLTFTEFKELSKSEIDEPTFDRLITKASAILNNITSHFYVKNDIEQDNEWRVNQFNQALCAQIEFFDEVGSTSFEGINNSPQTFKAGRTSVSNTSRFNASGENESKSLVAEDVYIHLEGTGLLFGGVSVW